METLKRVKAVRSKAPLRLGFAGGGTDVSPYCDLHGGYVLNGTINMYAYCTIEPTDNEKVSFYASDLNEEFTSEAIAEIETEGNNILQKGVYNRVVKDFCGGKPLSLKMTTYADAPAGSGLGTSSAMVVAILKAYIEWLNIPLGEYELANLAYKIEREDLKLLGGKQDQYASAFGGFNFIEFKKSDVVIVNPLRIKNWIKNELANSLILYYTGKSRKSAKIIEEQIRGTKENDADNLEGMHEIKEIAVEMKNAVIKGDFDCFAKCLSDGWEAKKKTASCISNQYIEEIYEFVIKSGAKSARISGAGGGGFMVIYCDPTKLYDIKNKLKEKEGSVMTVEFTEKGTQAWTIY